MIRKLVLLALAATTAAANAATPDWTTWDAVLEACVTRGERNGVALNLVDYVAMGRDARFADAVRSIEQWPLEALVGRQEILTFYINAYNILAAKMVIDHLPLVSIKDVGNLFRPVWKKPAGVLGGEVVTLDYIEHERLRKMGDPRIHMAIVCASVSCPDLRTEAYRVEDLDEQLDDQTGSFLANPSKGLVLDGLTAHTSQIFDWFGKDFAAAGGVASFVRRYRDLPDGTTIEPDLDYDWSLNSQPAE